MRHLRLVQLAFALCLAVAFGAMGWVSLRVIELDRAAAGSQRKAQLEENVRLALWRMDSALAPILAQENARPYAAYRASVFLLSPRNREDVTPIASPLLIPSSDIVELYFHIAPDGAITSPQVPTDQRMRTIVESNFVRPDALDRARARLADVTKKGLLDAKRLMAALPEVKPPEHPSTLLAQGNAQFGANMPANQPDRSQGEQQSQKGQLEYQARQSILRPSAQDSQNWNPRVYGQNFGRLIQQDADVYEGPVKPLWLGTRLVLARRVLVEHYDHIQGALLDWPATKAWLLSLVSDLVPGADLAAVEAPAAEKQPRLLAALPVRLVTEKVALAYAPPPSPTRLTLTIAWTCMLLASLAVALLLRGVMALSERRGAFVSAVTHELRTPLTTLRMYTEMLADGMVADEDRRRSYLSTLRSEADRLGHMVDNVLGYSRLERRRSAGRLEAMDLSELLGSIAPRLSDRATQAGMTLELEPTAGDGLRVMADAVALEQIVFNLVDNACKYAAGATDRRIHVRAEPAGKQVLLRVCDHGPGIAPEQARRLFRAFSKSVHEAANTKMPGLGLGLALSRRLARDMGGDLRYEGRADGACFVLSMTRATTSSTSRPMAQA